MHNSDSIVNHKSILEKCKFKGLNVVSSSGKKEKKYITQNLLGLLFKATYPEKIYFFGGLNYFLPEADKPEGLLEQAKNLIEMGADGMKMLEGKPTSRKRLGHTLDDSRYDKYYSYLEENKIPLLFHVADPAFFWEKGQIYGDGSYPGKEQFYQEVDNILEKHPGLRIIFSHFYFLSEERKRAANFLDKWPLISFDLTPGWEMYTDFKKEPDKWNQFFTKYQDRILFGTDNFGGKKAPDPEDVNREIGKINRIRTFLETKKGINLEKSVLEKIYSANFIKYAGESTSTLNPEKIIKKCKEMIQISSGYNQKVADQIKIISDKLININK